MENKDRLDLLENEIKFLRKELQKTQTVLSRLMTKLKIFSK
jgi:hypothetical protein